MRLKLLDRCVSIEAENQTLRAELARCFCGPAAQAGTDEPAQLTISVPAGREESGDLRPRCTPPVDVHAIRPGPLPGATQLAAFLTEWLVGSTEKYRVLHAGGIARAGVAILLPGWTHYGKSTLTARLVQAGWDLLSDEIGAIDLESGRVVPYPRAVFLRDRSLAVLNLEADARRRPEHADAELFGPEQLGGRWSEASSRLGAVVFPQFQRGAADRRQSLSPGDAYALLERSSAAQAQLGERGWSALTDVAAKTPCYRLIYSDLDFAVRTIEEIASDLDRH